MIDLGKHSIAGVRIDAVDYEATVRDVIRCATNAAHALFPRWPCTA